MHDGGTYALLGALALVTACGGDARDLPREREQGPGPSEEVAPRPTADAPAAAPPATAMATDEESPELVVMPPGAEVAPPLVPDDTADGDDLPPRPTPSVDPKMIVDACQVIGGFDRLVVKQHDLAVGSCTEVVLVSPAWQGVPPGLTMPESWGLEEAWLYACTSDGNVLPEGVVRTFDGVTGTVAFAGAPPRVLQLDLSMLGYGSEGMPTHLIVQDLEVSRICTTYGPTP